jgi:squalene-associated FAD-dependent desaturase
MPSKSVLVIGGGVAGIAAAVALSDRGFRVEIVEKRPLLGGRASSYLDPATGERLDECQHGTMRCCTNLTDLLTRLGVQDQIRYHDTLHFLDGDGVRSVIQGSALPAPLHTAPSFLRFRSLGLRDKLGIARGMMAMLRARPDPKHDTITVAEWFAQTGQTERAVQRFWGPILVSACNETNDRIAFSHALKIFRDGFLLHPTAFHFGVPRVPLGSLYTEPTLAYLAKRGGSVRLRTIVEELEFAQEAVPRITGISLRDGTRLQADYYVSALQFDLLLKLLPETVTANVPYWQNLHGLELSPICGVHLWFDRALDCPAALAVLDRETEWIFHKNLNFDQPEGGNSYLSIVISASHRLAGRPKEEILARVLADVHACLPDSRAATLLRSQIVRWPKATISPKPGVDALRPIQRSPISNLFVAGEWTRTGWPSTMEGAARSGYLAAEAILTAEGRPETLLAPDLPRSALARLLASR